MATKIEVGVSRTRVTRSGEAVAAWCRAKLISRTRGDGGLEESDQAHLQGLYDLCEVVLLGDLAQPPGSTSLAAPHERPTGWPEVEPSEQITQEQIHELFGLGVEHNLDVRAWLTEQYGSDRLEFYSVDHARDALERLRSRFPARG